MPVWHAFTRKYRAEGLLEVVGIATEQHPQRTQLFAQWQGFDWPILWDPFNLTGSKVVPNHIFVDEFGIVRSTRPRRETFEDQLLFADFERPAELGGRGEAGEGAEGEAGLAGVPRASLEHDHLRALGDLLWSRGESLDGALDVIEQRAATQPDDERFAFWAGVARRMRFDSERARADDFQAAVDHWARALVGDPTQYIWRRRLQQYGPRMDKPYNFYSWVAIAQRELTARGERPVELVATLTPAELAEQHDFEVGDAASEPDPEARVPLDGADGRPLISIETAVVFDTSGKRSIASVHLALRPVPEREAHWNHEVDALRVWIDQPEGWSVDRKLLEHPPRADVATSTELRTLSFELELPEDVRDAALGGYALYYVCAGAEGTCEFLRQEFSVRVERR